MGFIVAINNNVLDEIFDTYAEAQNVAENSLTGEGGTYPGDYCDIYKIEKPLATGVVCTAIDWENYQVE